MSPITFGVSRGRQYGTVRTNLNSRSPTDIGVQIFVMTSTDTRPKRFVSRQHTNHPATLELLPSEFPATFPGSVLLFMPQVLRVYPVGQKMSSIPYKRNIN